MRRARICLIQMSCRTSPESNISKAERAVRAAAANDARLCVLPEAFANRYVGQFEDTERVLQSVPDHRHLVERFRTVAEENHTAVVVPFIEKAHSGTVYNSEVLIGYDGRILGHYRKLHIPDSEGYREDLYFTPGNKGYVVADLEGLKVGLGICWDQWFPEMARILALRGAQLLVYPSAIGSEIAHPEFDSRSSWELVMRANAVMNRVFVAAVNRVGQEERIKFYGSSFVSDPWGNVIARASSRLPAMIYAEIDPSEICRANSFFGFMTTRRPDTYGYLTRRRAATLAERKGAGGGRHDL